MARWLHSYLLRGVRAVDHFGDSGLYDEDLGFGVLVAVLLGVLGDVFTAGCHPGAEDHQRRAIFGSLLVWLAEIRDALPDVFEVPVCACHRVCIIG